MSSYGCTSSSKVDEAQLVEDSGNEGVTGGEVGVRVPVYGADAVGHAASSAKATSSSVAEERPRLRDGGHQDHHHHQD